MVEDYDDYEDELEDDMEDQAESQQEAQQDAYEGMSPSAKEKPDLFSLFWKVIEKIDSSKVSNVNKQELGMLEISVRDCQRIKLIAYQLGHKKFGDFFDKQGEITLSTSASKEGWLAELFVSQKKTATKKREQSVRNLPEVPHNKKLTR